MHIKNLATGEIWYHTEVFHQTSFPTSGPSAQWLQENGCEEYIPPVYVPTVEAIEEQRIACLWQQAHDYEYAAISGSAVGLLTLGVIQGRPKCIEVQIWIKSIWTLYYAKKADSTINVDFDSCGACPYSVPELMAEIGI